MGLPDPLTRLIPSGLPSFCLPLAWTLLIGWLGGTSIRRSGVRRLPPRAPAAPEYACSGFGADSPRLPATPRDRSSPWQTRRASPKSDPDAPPHRPSTSPVERVGSVLVSGWRTLQDRRNVPGRSSSGRHPGPGDESERARAHRWGAACLFAVPPLVLWRTVSWAGAAAVGLSGVAGWAWSIRTRRVAKRRREGEVAAALPDVVDLLCLCAGAGLTVPLAVERVAPHVKGTVGEGLLRVVAEVDRGRRWADALGDLPRSVGEPMRTVSAALVAAERHGTPLGPILERVAAELRGERRRAAEAAARRVPVRLLFPLVMCVLPAFVLLTLAPLIAGALGSLRL